MSYKSFNIMKFPLILVLYTSLLVMRIESVIYFLYNFMIFYFNMK